MTFRGASSAIGIALVLIYAIGSGIWVSHSPGWYASLNRPPWQPPDVVFGIIWPYNFIVLGVSAFTVARNLPRAQTITWLSIFAISIIAALNWAYQFYVPHNLSIATLSLGIAAILTVPILILTFRASTTVGLLLIPYQLWVAIATTLAWGYSVRN